MFRGMKILITGSKGQLGTDCQALFGAEGHEIAAYDLPDIDIADREGMRRVLDAFRPEVLVNAAAYTAVDRAEGEGRESCWRANRDGPKVLAELAAERGIRLIHVSTDYVFAGDRPVPEAYVETDEPGPTSEYGKSKLAGEEAVRAAGGEWTILRTAWFYGARGHNFLKAVLRRAQARPGEPLKVVADQYGSPTGSWALARQIALVLREGATGLFHATDEGYTTWHGFAAAFFREMGMDTVVLPCATADYPTPTKRPANSILENAALKARGINAMPRWEDDLAGYVQRNREALLAETRPAEG
jgi:dTDP-4-dehydrorhamnose reductase